MTIPDRYGFLIWAIAAARTSPIAVSAIVRGEVVVNVVLRPDGGRRCLRWAGP